ncbi:hypothetical protein POM88_050219 [Heracleum sosnowskyi]|uniref:Uncharacterized protein n=1 Tax=Heracleum sosnowskyi TaxID=360622 RepID=A0AAD8GYG5_9APIA|nr:hypothetical protein POM88_050216 [Heracleum sosnowskyi]KAK1356963.1 hypothetical protein POM88_050219 [Heracleum sosnowskyi]
MGYEIVRFGKSQLEVRVRKTRPNEVVRPCPLNCKSSNRLRITFFTYTRKRYVDLNSSLIGTKLERTGEETICVDKRLLFKDNSQTKNFIKSSGVLESLNVKEYLHDKIISQIVSMGDVKNKGGKKVKRKIYKGLDVDLTLIKTFLADQESVWEVFQTLIKEYGLEPSEIRD